MAITNLGENTRSRPQWMVMLGALGLVVTILVLVLAGWKAPLDETIKRQERDIQQIESGVVPRIEHEYHWRDLEQSDIDNKSRLDLLEGSGFTAGSPGLRP